MLWSWILTIIGVTGFALAGRKVWWAWYINIANQFLWAAYAITTQQWGFLLAIPVYLAVFIPNAIKWTKEHRADFYWTEQELADAKKRAQERYEALKPYID